MALYILIALPLAAGLAAFVLRADGPRRLLLPVTGVLHFALCVYSISHNPGPEWGGWLMLDGLGALFLLITSLLFLACSFYTVGYLDREHPGEREDFEEGLIFTNAPEALFIGCMLFFLSAMTAVTLLQHFGLIWVGIEATTVASAPLIYFHRHRRSLEATWKYLLICSVGIAIALMGYMFLAIASSYGPEGGSPTVVADLVADGAQLQGAWLKVAFILFLVGYGTKVGLAPLHTWLPDAHSESPSAVSALLSGALLNCAFLGILRVYQVCAAAGLGQFARELFVVMGLFSMAVAAVFIFGQADYKRMLAYSSVEHMGIVSLGVGLGGGAAFGAMLHALNHSLTKGLLFLVAGNILSAYKTKTASEVHGVLRVVPASGMLWMLGFLAITGSPPFGPFISEFTVLKGALDTGSYAVASVFIVILAVIFIGMSTVVLGMSLGVPRYAQASTGPAESPAAVIPPLALAAAVLSLGLYMPAPVTELVAGAASLLGGM